jgi:hypothetical protein
MKKGIYIYILQYCNNINTLTMKTKRTITPGMPIKVKFLEAKIKWITNQYLTGDITWAHVITNIANLCDSELAKEFAIEDCLITNPNTGE